MYSRVALTREFFMATVEASLLGLSNFRKGVHVFWTIPLLQTGIESKRFSLQKVVRLESAIF